MAIGLRCRVIERMPGTHSDARRIGSAPMARIRNRWPRRHGGCPAHAWRLNVSQRAAPSVSPWPNPDCLALRPCKRVHDPCMQRGTCTAQRAAATSTATPTADFAAHPARGLRLEAIAMGAAAGGLGDRVAGMQVSCCSVSTPQPAMAPDSGCQSSSELDARLIVERSKIDQRTAKRVAGEPFAQLFP